jgi:hypothetical protein
MAVHARLIVVRVWYLSRDHQLKFKLNRSPFCSRVPAYNTYYCCSVCLRETNARGRIDRPMNDDRCYPAFFPPPPLSYLPPYVPLRRQHRNRCLDVPLASEPMWFSPPLFKVTRGSSPQALSTEAAAKSQDLKFQIPQAHSSRSCFALPALWCPSSLLSYTCFVTLSHVGSVSYDSE